MSQRPLSTYLGAALLGSMLVMGAVGQVWTPHDPLAINVLGRLASPSAAHLLGTDEFGRDVLSRLMAGAATSMRIAAMTVAFALTVGFCIGIIMGYARGLTDRILSAINDALLAFPGLLLALGFLAIFGASENGIVLALGFAFVPVVVRVARASAMSLRETAFAEASLVIGNSRAYTVFRHIMPNALSPMTVLATAMFGWVVLSESALSFLGLGVPPPAPTWGSMLAASRPYIGQAEHLVLLPGLCIAMTLLGVNLLGDALRDRLDPRMSGGL
jgi:peptide/nickel transport system permease protein